MVFEGNFLDCENDYWYMNAIPGHNYPRMILPRMQDIARHSGTVTGILGQVVTHLVVEENI